MGLRRFLALVALAVFILLLVTVWFFPSSRDFRTDNPFWNGASDVSDLPAARLRSLSDLPAEPGGATLILVPYLEFSAADLQRLRSFIADGGTVVLADDYGHGNQVLEYLGVPARFSGQALLDPLVNYKTAWFPRTYKLEPNLLTDGVDGLVLNHATCLTDVAAGDVLAYSSGFSFLDLNGNGTWDRNEPLGPLPVVSQQSLGDGRIVLISDSSLFINSMEDIGGNRRFIRNIAAASTALFIDQSHLPSASLDRAKDGLAVVRGSLAGPIGTFGLVGLALAIVLRPIWHKPRGL